MKIFKMLDNQEIIVHGDIEEKGVLETENGYELCDKSHESSFITVNAIYESGTYYVDFNEPSEWADSNIIIGNIKNTTTATIEVYKTNATLFILENYFEINWDELEFDNREELENWVTEELTNILNKLELEKENIENYEDIALSLYIATEKQIH